MKTSHFIGTVRNAALEEPGVQVSQGSAPEDGLLGLTIREYTVTELLGQGAAGVVYGATKSDGTEVALKVLPRNPDETPDEKTIFEREVKIGRELNHPAVVAIYDTFELGPANFVVMEWVKGTTLADIIDSGMETSRFIDVLSQLVSGLQAAHELSVIHRDLKPENIMLSEDGAVKILDFGMAKNTKDKNVTLSGSFKGTLKYASPEQFQDSKRVEPACDQFAVGLIIFEVLSGQFPYEIDEKFPFKTVMARLTGKAAELHTVAPNHSPETGAVLARMLAQDPAERYPSVQDAFDELRATLI